MRRRPIIALALLTSVVPLAAQFRRAGPLGQDTQPSPSATPNAPPKKPEPVITDDQVIKVETALVNLYFTARSSHGGYMANLRQEDLDVYEDGKLQTIKKFGHETDQPLTLGLLVDVSKSQERLIEDERNASARFFEQVLRPKDMAFLLSFGIDSELIQDSTNSPRILEQALREVRMNAGAPSPTPTTVDLPMRGTVLYDAVYLAANEKMRQEVGRKALVLLTDGDDYGSKVRPAEAIEAAQRADSIVYVILYEDPRFTNPMYGGRSGEGEMKHLTEDTGGHTFRVSRSTPLSAIYDQLQEELRSQYVLTYTPTNEKRDGGFRKIELRLKNRKDVKILVRKGYYASPAGE